MACCEACAKSGGSCADGKSPSGTTLGPKGTLGMMRYVVVNGDTPMGLARRITGDGSRYPELIAANPHKPRSGSTFASLGVGETIVLPPPWVAIHGTLQGLGRALARVGVGDAAPPPPGANAADLTTLQADVQAISDEAAAGTLCQANNQSVLQFQNDYDATSFTGNDGKYGPNTVAAAQSVVSAMPSITAPAACAGYGNTAPTTFTPSANLVALAQTLDGILAQTPANTCTANDTSSQVALATYAFKQAALATPGCSGTACATVAPGVTVNTVGNAGYAYGPGSDTLLSAVLLAGGATRTYKGGPWTDSEGNCLATGGTVPNPNPNPAPSPSGAASSSSTGPIIIGLLLLAAAGGAVYYAKKHPDALKKHFAGMHGHKMLRA